MIILDFIYKLFFTVISISVLSVLLVPVVMIIRLVTSKAPRKYMVWLWMLICLRMLCPLSLSSTLCINKEWNRHFHILMTKFGLDMPDVKGMMTGWFTVFANDISTTRSYRVCALIWLSGVILIWGFVFIRQCQLSHRLKGAVRLYDNVYQSEDIGCPMIKGIFKGKIYIPKEMKASEAKYILMHMECHNKRKDRIFKFVGMLTLSIHWFNLLIWLANYLLSVDIELAADDYVVRKMGLGSCKEYAQEIINMYKKKDGLPDSFYTFRERYIEKRASGMLYYRKPDKTSGQVLILTFLLCFVWWFMMRPLQILWNGELDKNQQSQSKEERLFAESDSTAITKLTTLSPDGLNRVVQLSMTNGSYKQGEGYEGSFELVFLDTFGTELSRVDLNSVFRSSAGDTLHFDEGLTMYADDYNDDGTQELVIGQDIGKSDESFAKATGELKNKAGQSVQEYYIWNIDVSSLNQIAGPIYTTSEKEDTQSKKFDVVNRKKGIFAVTINGRSTYYKWDKNKETYLQKSYTKKQINKLRGKQKEADTGTSVINHTLKNDMGDTVIKINTKKDNTGSEVIKEIILDPKGANKQYTDIKGYYCDIKWASEDKDERYAVLTYNGTNSQTFVIFDTRSNEVFYKNEDGHSMLTDIFREYNSNDINFNSENVVVYNLQAINDDVITIGFAADTADDKTVRGQYKYNVTTGRYKDFSYTQNK